MTTHARGPFDVTVTPQAPDDATVNTPLGRLLLDKRFHGPLDAASTGQMLAVGTGQEGSSGGYVALEWVVGTLDGRSGAFALQHNGSMTRGAAELTITVVPDSGADQLAGLAGTMTIEIVDGEHRYDFTYTLPDSP